MLRVAIVGCGKIADQHLEAIRRIPEAQVVGVCDREALMAEQLAERHNVQYWSADLRQLLCTVRPDVVHITTPPQSHFALAMECLDAGCHIYVEKPFTLDTNEASRLIQSAVNRDLKLTVGHNLQFTWENLEARALVKSGFLGGAPVHIESYFTYNLGDAAYAKALLGDRQHWVRTLPGKLLHNIISHGIARIAEFMHSDAPRVAAFGGSSPLLRQLGEDDIDDEVRVYVSDAANTTAFFVFSSQMSPPVNGFRLYGPRNSLVVDNVHRTLIRLPNRHYKSYLNHLIGPVGVAREYVHNARRNMGRFLRARFHDDSGLTNLIHAFYRAVAAEAPLPIPYREILLTSRIMDDTFRQLARAEHEPARDHALGV